jgi:uncharacterized protein (DUF885 family)
MYSTLARAFPVCCASDEFYYFPQIVLDDADWSVWDDFSPERIGEVTSDLAHWETALDGLLSTGPELDTQIDIDLLLHSARTLREQLQEVRFHRNQPTFQLTVATVGLIQAMDSPDENAWRLRTAALQDYFDNAGLILSDVPELYRDLGYQMVDSFRVWLGTMSLEAPESSGVSQILEALERYRERLEGLAVKEDFLLAPELVDRITSYHMATKMTVADLLIELGHEKAKMVRNLKTESNKHQPGQPWQDYWDSIPLESYSKGDKKDLLEREIRKLKGHCLELGLSTPGLIESSPVEIADVHDSMTPVRAADSYSARPGYPPSGGTFYVFGGGSLGLAEKTIHPVYRMTAAHETYPGHHLLDVSRWNLERPLRRSLERPVFYEGWSCFAEQLLIQTGYFSQPWDAYMLARRRLRHATRGTVDLLLHTGRLDLEDAAELLAEAGFSKGRAMETVRKYALRPGYQMCYTIGYGRFKQLFERYGGSDVSGFARTVLTQGEIRFDLLERVLQRSNKSNQYSVISKDTNMP